MLGEWIYLSKEASVDSYACFQDEFEYKGEGETILEISCDSEYACYLNNELVSFGMYQSYGERPILEKIVLSPKVGRNELKIIHYYLGTNEFFTYIKGEAGLFFQVLVGDCVLAFSNEKTLSSPCLQYLSGLKKKISPQLGYSFTYDENKKIDRSLFTSSRIVKKSKDFSLRPTKKCELKPIKEGKILRMDGTNILLDLEEEIVGFLEMKLVSLTDNNEIVVSWSEHLLNDGSLPRKIGNRDFSFTYIAKEGKNDFLSPFRRLGCRYLEIKATKPISLFYCGIREVSYPFIVKPYILKDPLLQRIYDVSLRTLKCCYHEHYEDCPWREQSFYMLDSRNQMLCGYDAFSNKETARSALALVGLDKRKDGLLSICYPSAAPLCIPSFCLHYFIAVDEYYQATHDLSLLEEVFPKLKEVMTTFLNNVKDDVLTNFKGDEQWNFYEWSEGLDYLSPKIKQDVILNSYFLLALSHMDSICRALGKDSPYGEIRKRMIPAIKKEFYDPLTSLFIMAKEDPRPSILGNSLAILSGLSSAEESQIIISKMLTEEDSFLPMTLSMRCYYYDALLKVSAKYQDIVLEDIVDRYSKMLNEGATTFFETEKGWKDFDCAGSLCHGWSATPIHYFRLFSLGKEE